ncbi:MAG: hypothetical protein ACXU7Z_06485 [Burkholderiaceae bacterium]
MPVQCKRVNEVLQHHGLRRPELEVLAPTEQSYRALLLQPSGPILANANFIGHLNAAEAEQRCRKYLELAVQRGNHLVITPEYCLPISVLLECVQGATFPAAGAIWVLGCESITPAQLSEFRLSSNGHCLVIAEDDLAAEVQGTFYDAVAYCFQTMDDAGVYKRVVIFQFKTCPSRDLHFFENQHLRVGHTIYQFQGHDDLLRLSTIICSDAFTIGNDIDLCRSLTDRSTLIHIQLNPDPRHADYLMYRKVTFARSPEYSNCDIVCLNWSRNIQQHHAPESQADRWNNIGGSAWYLPYRRCSTMDHEVQNNDAKGLYYSLLEKYRHILLFHYDEAAYELRVPKVGHNGQAVLDNPLGPQVEHRLRWNSQTSNWELNPDDPDTGLLELLSVDEHVVAAFSELTAANNRLSIERAISLSCGPEDISETWYRVDRLEPCQMKSDEIVQRTTFCMDPCGVARKLRNDRVQIVSALAYILANEKLPPQISDLAGGDAKVVWNVASPNTNIAKENSLPALVAYLGVQPLHDRLENVAAAAYELLRKENKEHQRRVAICYRKVDNTTAFFPIKALTRIDFDGESLAKITEALE